MKKLLCPMCRGTNLIMTHIPNMDPMPKSHSHIQVKEPSKDLNLNNKPLENII